MKILYIFACLMLISVVDCQTSLKVPPSSINWSQSLPSSSKVIYETAQFPEIKILTDGTTIEAINESGELIISAVLNVNDSAVFDAAVAAFDGPKVIKVVGFDGQYFLNYSVTADRNTLFSGYGADLNLVYLNAPAFLFNSSGNRLWSDTGTSGYNPWCGLLGFKITGYSGHDNPNTDQWISVAENTTRYFIARDITFGYCYNGFWMKGMQYSNTIENCVGYMVRGTGVLLDATGPAAGGYNAYNFKLEGTEISNYDHSTSHPYYNDSLGVVIDADADDGISLPQDVHITDCYLENFDTAITNEGKSTQVIGCNLRSNENGVVMPAKSTYVGWFPIISGCHISGGNAGVKNLYENNVIGVSDCFIEYCDIGIYGAAALVNVIKANDNTFYRNDIAINGSVYGTIGQNIFQGVTGNYAILTSRLTATVVGNTFEGYSDSAHEITQYTTWARPIMWTNYGHPTIYSGTSTGTGSQQTIAHKLDETPNQVIITPTASGATETSITAASDATNIYPTVTNGKTYQWTAMYVPMYA